MLHEGLEGVPAEGLGQLLRSDPLLIELEVIKDSLKGQTHGFGRIVSLGWDLVDILPQAISEIQHLKLRQEVNYNREENSNSD